VDGCVRFRAKRPYQPGEFTYVRLLRTAGLNYIGEETENA